MKTAIFFIFTLFAVVSGQITTTPDPFIDEPEPNAVDVGTEIISLLFNSEAFQSKLQRVYELIDLKIRFVKLMRALLSRENLALVRRILDYIARVCNYIIQFLPEPAPDNKGSILQALFPVVNLQENPANFERVDRDANFTPDDAALFEKHKDDVVQVAKLIYNTR